MAQKITWKDEEIRTLDGRRFYLRIKQYRQDMTYTIRTQKNGNGVRMAQVRFNLNGQESIDEALRKLVKSWRKFYVVKLIPAWENK